MNDVQQRWTAKRMSEALRERKIINCRCSFVYKHIYSVFIPLRFLPVPYRTALFSPVRQSLFPNVFSAVCSLCCMVRANLRHSEYYWHGIHRCSKILLSISYKLLCSVHLPVGNHGTNHNLQYRYPRYLLCKLLPLRTDGKDTNLLPD